MRYTSEAAYTNVCKFDFVWWNASPSWLHVGVGEAILSVLSVCSSVPTRRPSARVGEKKRMASACWHLSFSCFVKKKNASNYQKHNIHSPFTFSCGRLLFRPPRRRTVTLSSGDTAEVRISALGYCAQRGVDLFIYFCIFVVVGDSYTRTEGSIIITGDHS